MNYIGKVLSNFKEVYNEINGATLTGAIDAVVVRQEDGSYISSPFHVRFGKIGVLRSKEKVVDIEINGNPVDIRMKLGDTGEAFFVEEVTEDDEDVCSLLGTSPLPNIDFYNYSKEDDLKSQDSGVEAEETLLVHGNTDDCISNQPTQQPIVDTSSFTTDVYPSHYTEEPSESYNQDELTSPENYKQDAELVNPESYNQDAELVSSGNYNQDAELVSSCNYNQDAELVTPANYHQDDVELVTPAGGNLGILKREPRSLQPTVSNPLIDTWKPEDHLVRSKSLTTEAELLQALLEGRGSKTDGEEFTTFPTRNPRRKRKKRAPKHLVKVSESQSSDNSTTSETADLSSFVVTGVANGVAASASSAINPHDDTIFVIDDILNTHHNNDQSTIPSQIPYLTSNWTPPMIKSKSWAGHRTLGPDFHPFSDTDISPSHSPGNSRSASPVKSDTEYEYEKQKTAGHEADRTQDHNKWSWTWGELPTPPASSNPMTGQNGGTPNQLDKSISMVTNIPPQSNEEAQRSMLGNMFSFMRATKKARHNPEVEGIYLDDLSKLDQIDPEVAALYFPRNSLLGKHEYTDFRPVAKDDDVESGNGTSLPQSPHSVEGAIGGSKITDSDFEDCRHKDDLAFSMCGALANFSDDGSAFPESLFQQSLVTYDDFCEKPDLLRNPNLVVRFEGKFMNWTTAAPQIMSYLLFQRHLPPKVVECIEMGNMPKKERRDRKVSRGYSWFSWGSRNIEEVKIQESKEELVRSNTAILPDQIPEISSSAEVIQSLQHEDSIMGSKRLDEESNKLRGNEANLIQKQRIRTESSGSDDDENKHRGRYKKSLRLSSEQIKKLDLRNGSNEVIFSVTTAYQGTTRCKCHIFLWNHDEKIIVSDIDGTITKSDVLGHILPIIGKDWAQLGVAQLFTKIKNNGYNFLYLSARAIGQARITRDYLRSIKQGDVSLPDGPLLLNPTSLIQAFHREVIEKKPEEFKISCLRDIQGLFPGNPFYAGYGNRVNDVYAYRALGIPISRIFTINHRGELKHELTQAFQTTYSNLSDIAHHMFPPNNDQNFLNEFSSLKYWRIPLPDHSRDIELEMEKIKTKPKK